VPTLATLAAALAASRFGPTDVGAALLVAYLASLYAIYHGISLIHGLHDDDRVLLGHLWEKVTGPRT
jgi:hypothetical protein